MVHPIYVHVGLPKTGTTSLQWWLHWNRERLARQGFLYPGDRVNTHWLATLDLQRRSFAGHRMPAAEGAWTSLVEQISAWQGPALISHELLAASQPAKVGKVVQDLAGRELHVVLTVRDLSAVAPATWQERAKNGRLESWADFIEGIGRGPAGGHDFWRLQNASAVLRRWSKHVGGERIHVVTVPPAGGDRRLLLQRFSEVVGLDHATFEDPPPRSNESIGAVEVAVVKRFNELLRGGSVDFDTYHRLVKHLVVPDFLVRRPAQQRFRLPASAAGWIEWEVERTRKTIERLGCRVVGDLDELAPRCLLAAGEEGVDPDAVERDQVDRASAELIIELADALRRERRRAAQRPVAGSARVSAMQRAKGRVVRAGERSRMVGAALQAWRWSRRTVRREPGSGRV